MNSQERAFHEFAEFAAKLKGDEKSEAQTLLFHLLEAFKKPSAKQIRAVADAARELRALRRQIMDANGWSLRDLYRTLETPGDNKLRDAHAALDTAVRDAYGMKEKEDILAFLLKKNLELAEMEKEGKPITPPGLPSFVPKPADFVSKDCVAVR